MARDKALFGPAGNCDDFHAAGYKHTVQMFPWIAQHGLTAYEYQCGRGVRLSAESAAAMRAEAEKDLARSQQLLHTDHFDIYQLQAFVIVLSFALTLYSSASYQLFHSSFA